MSGLPCERCWPQHCSTEGSSVSHAPIPPEAQEATQPSPCSVPQPCWQNLNSERRKERSRPVGCSSQVWLVPGAWGPWVWCHCSLAQVTSACSCPSCQDALNSLTFLFSNYVFWFSAFRLSHWSPSLLLVGPPVHLPHCTRAIFLCGKFDNAGPYLSTLRWVLLERNPLFALPFEAPLD